MPAIGSDRDTLTTGDAKDYAATRRNGVPVLLCPEGRLWERSLRPGGRPLTLAIVVVVAGELDQDAGGLSDLGGVGRLLPPPLAEPVVVVAGDHVDVEMEDRLRAGHAIGVGLHEVHPAGLEGAGRQPPRPASPPRWRSSGRGHACATPPAGGRESPG